MAKYKCDCGKMAVWYYLPGYAKDSNPFSCDDCVISVENKIGCSCNWNYAKPQEHLPTDMPEGVEGKDWRWVEFEGDEYMDPITKEEGYWIYIDERGRPYPCVEYEYDEDGFDIPTFFTKLWWSIDLKWFLFKDRLRSKYRTWLKKHIDNTH